MRRRLDIAMSLIGEPAAILLDEPTTGLDPEARLEVWETVKGLAGRGTTVLLTTQHLEEAEHLADRIAILHQGRTLRHVTRSVSTGVAIIICFAFPSWASSPSWWCARRTSRRRRRSTGSSGHHRVVGELLVGKAGPQGCEEIE